MSNRKFRRGRIFVGDYSPRASKIRDDETKHHRDLSLSLSLSPSIVLSLSLFSGGRLAGPIEKERKRERRDGHFQNSDETPHLGRSYTSVAFARSRLFSFASSLSLPLLPNEIFHRSTRSALTYSPSGRFATIYAPRENSGDLVGRQTISLVFFLFSSHK